MNIRFYIFIFFVTLSGIEPSIAQKKIFGRPQPSNLPTSLSGRQAFQPSNSLSTSCPEITARADLDVNNVRAMILGSADMWWDFAWGRYEIPKGGGVNAIFAGSLWIGAIDNLGQLKVAAQTYRQTGNDFWSGPVDTVNGISPDSACWKYDRVWNVSRFMVEEFIQRYNDPSYTIPKDILEWPAHGDQSKNEAYYLAPFIDKNADGIYKPADGDYPAYDFTGTQNCQYNLLGDQTLWWVFNDVGGTHTETGGDSLGLEIHAQAFSFQTNDEINDATFYQYKVINRSTFTLDSMYWGQWIDYDLGCYTDDYVACDVKRGLGYTYNGDNDDEVACASPGYGLHPPAIGCDFLGGPLANANDGVDNDRDSIIDEIGERIMMSNTLNYYATNGVPYGHPSGATHFYNYIKSKWGDGIPMRYDGQGGYNTTGTGPVCKFVFPGTTDPYGWGTGGIPMPPWDEVSAGNTPGDVRFLMSAGPFTMQPGEVQYITHGIIWGRDAAGDALAGVVAMQKADDKAQTLFDACFDMPCYPPVAQINHTANELEVLFGAYSQGTTYSWDFGDGTYSIQKFPKHTYAASGTYNVCLVVTNTCGTDSICKLVSVANNPPPPWGFRLKRIEGNGNGGRTLDWLPQYYDSVLANNRVLHPLYDYLTGPVNVAAYDTTLVPTAAFVLKFDTVGPSAKWKLYRKGYTDTVFADSSISTGYTQMIPQWGMQVHADTSVYPGNRKDFNNGFLEATMEFSDASKKWLSGLRDVDYPSYDNWIRSGYKTGSGAFQDDYTGSPNPDIDEVYEGMLGGTWAPYRLTACTDMIMQFNGGYDVTRYYSGPGFKTNFMNQPRMQDLASVDIILTSDKTKWSRCVVLEMCEDTNYSVKTSTTESKKSRKLDFRRAPSVDKSGNANYPSADNNDYPSGMGWFPGYAVNLETGERLNIAFGENSALGTHNGNDMLWNPGSTKLDSIPWGTAAVTTGPVYGGQHYIYVFGHNKDNSPTGILPVDTINIPAYDGCKRLRKGLSWDNNQPNDVKKRELIRDAMWVNIPLLEPGRSLLETDVKIRLRVTKRYSKGYSTAYYMSGTTAVYYTDTSSAPLNRNFPMYEFESKDFGPKTPTPFVMVGYSFYPNPFSNSGTLWFENKESAPHELKIFDIRGRIVRHYTNLTGQSAIIEKGSLRSGIYFYSLTLDGAKKALGKFVVL